MYVLYMPQTFLKEVILLLHGFINNIVMSWLQILKALTINGPVPKAPL